MTLTIPLLLLTIHFVADFVFQSDWMAIQKSKRWDALALHCLTYALCFVPFVPNPVVFTLITFVTHFVQDALTSRLNAWVYPRNRHYFFVGIGADQLLHAYALAWTWSLLV